MYDDILRLQLPEGYDVVGFAVDFVRFGYNLTVTGALFGLK